MLNNKNTNKTLALLVALLAVAPLSAAFSGRTIKSDILGKLKPILGVRPKEGVPFKEIFVKESKLTEEGARVLKAIEPFTSEAAIDKDAQLSVVIGVLSNKASELKAEDNKLLKAVSLALFENEGALETYDRSKTIFQHAVSAAKNKNDLVEALKTAGVTEEGLTSTETVEDALFVKPADKPTVIDIVKGLDQEQVGKGRGMHLLGEREKGKVTKWTDKKENVEKWLRLNPEIVKDQLEKASNKTDLKTLLETGRDGAFKGMVTVKEDKSLDIKQPGFFTKPTYFYGAQTGLKKTGLVTTGVLTLFVATTGVVYGVSKSFREWLNGLLGFGGGEKEAQVEVEAEINSPE